MNLLDLPDELLYIITQRSILHEYDFSYENLYTYSNLPMTNKYFNSVHKNRRTIVRHVPDDPYGFYMFSI